MIRTLIGTRATVTGGTCTVRSGQMRTAAPIVILRPRAGRLRLHGEQPGAARL